MTFVDGFYSFNINITDSGRNLYTSIRLKTPKHPQESFDHLFSRVLAYAHCYQPEQEFSRGLFEVREPSIWRKDVIGNLKLWVQVGELNAKKLKKALREDSDTCYRVYFYDFQQKYDFCHNLRGSKSNWVENVEFYEIDAESIAKFAPLTQSSSNWDVTILDDHLYLLINGVEGEAKITPFDIWETYQVSISNGNLGEVPSAI